MPPPVLLYLFQIILLIQRGKIDMTRSNAREIAMHISFEIGVNPMPTPELIEVIFDKEYYKSLAKECEVYEDYPNEKQLEYIKRLAMGIGEHSYELDTYIEKYAKGWRVGRISRVAVAIMRIAMFEVMYMPEIPNGAAINEAVELCKKYEEQDTVSFVNGILGTFVRSEMQFETEKAPEN